MREECDQFKKNDVLPIWNLFNKNEIGRGFVSDEKGGLFLLEGIAPSGTEIDAGQIDDIAHPENGIPHLIAVADSLQLGVEVKSLEKSEQVFARVRKGGFHHAVFCAVKFCQNMRKIPLYRLCGVFQLIETSIIIMG